MTSAQAIDLVQLYAACVCSTTLRAQDKKLRGPLNSIVSLVAKDHSLPEDLFHFAEAIDLLEGIEVVKSYVHDGMDVYFKVDGREFERMIGPSSTAGLVRTYAMLKPFNQSPKFEVLETFCDLGDDWLADALSTYRSHVNDQYNNKEIKGNSSSIALASDREVNFKDNQDVIEEISENLSEIEREIISDNEVGYALGDSRDIAVTEIRQLRNMISAGKARARTLLNYATDVLSWILKKTAETSLSETVKHVTKLLIGWLS